MCLLSSEWSLLGPPATPVAQVPNIAATHPLTTPLVRLALLERSVVPRLAPSPASARSMSLLASSSTSVAAAKRRKIRGVVGIKGISTEALVAVLKEAKAQDLDITSRWQVQSLVTKEFGKVHHSIQLPLAEGGTFAWKVCRVDSLMHYFASESAGFRASLLGALERAGPRPLSCILYLDEIVPGNILRPDNRRKFWSIYLSFEELGRERLFLEQYWLPLAVLRSSVVGTVAGGLSNCFRLLVRSLLLDPVPAANAGFALDLGAGASLIRLRVSSVVGDEAALKSVWGSKGAAGTRPCFFLRELRVDFFEVGGHDPRYCRHFVCRPQVIPTLCGCRCLVCL